MGFFSDLKEDLSQAVNELMPDNPEPEEQLTAEPVEEETVSLDEMLQNIDDVIVPDEMLQNIGADESPEDMLQKADAFAAPEETPDAFEEERFTLEKMLEYVDDVEVEPEEFLEEIAADMTDAAPGETAYETDGIHSTDYMQGAAAETSDNTASETAENTVYEENMAETLADTAYTENMEETAGNAASEENTPETPVNTAYTESIADITADTVYPENTSEVTNNAAYTVNTPETTANAVEMTDNAAYIVETSEMSDNTAYTANTAETAKLTADEPADAAGTYDLESMVAKALNAEPEEMTDKGEEKNMDTYERREVVDETSVITAAMMITGDIVSEGSVDVIGTINGNIDVLGKLNVTGHISGNSKAAEIYADSAKINGEVVSDGAVKVGASSVIIGNITATSAVIAGAVKGDIDVKGPVILDASAIVMGNIKSKSVQINNGAVIEGMCSQCYADVSPTSFFDEYKMDIKKAKQI